MKELHLQYHKNTGIRMHDKIRDIKYDHNEVYDYITWLENAIEEAEKMAGKINKMVDEMKAL